MIDHIDTLKAQQMKALSKHLPLNSFNLPTGYWRADLIPNENPPAQFSGEYIEVIEEQGNLNFEVNGIDIKHSHKLPQLLQPGPINGGNLPRIPTPLNLPQDVLDAAFVNLSYDEGYPALPNGFPFWDRLPNYESVEAHQKFQDYLELGKSEFRMLPNLADNPEELAELQYFHAIYYWGPRSKSYDLFEQASKRRRKEQLIFDLELEHLQVAQKYRKQITEYMNSSEFSDTLTPMVAVNLLKLCWQMERASAGLPINGPTSTGTLSRGNTPVDSASLELTIRQIISRERTVEGSDGQVIEQDGSLSSTDPFRDFQDQLLSNPDLVTLAQDLVLKLTQSSTNRG